ncbi:MAG: biotin biosynthesis protein BioC [Microgenomates bacterium OLB22]|nr:MAG: biotin biosynthesis protein BioC [Microgenomates bacterium OLB22]
MSENLPQNEPSIEDHTDEEVFQNYMEDLKLSPEDFDKRILDVGSGSSQFAKWARDHHVSSQIFSLEPKQEPQERTKSVQGKAEAIPFQSEVFDLVVSNASIPNIFLGESPETVKERVRSSLFELMRVTKPGGEIRLGRVLRGKVYESQEILASALDEAFAELRRDYGIEIEEIPYPAANTYEYVNHQPVKIAC